MKVGCGNVLPLNMGVLSCLFDSVIAWQAYFYQWSKLYE